MLTDQDRRNVKTGFKRAYPISHDANFDQLLAALDQASRRTLFSRR